MQQRPVEEGVGPRLDPHLLAAAAGAGVTLAGSLLGVPEHHRVAASRLLGEHGCWVHADVIDGSFGGRPGVTADQVAQVSGGSTAQIDVHLMVDDVARWLERLPAGLDRVTVQVRSPDDLDWIGLGRERAREVWMAIDPKDVTRRGWPGQVDRLAAAIHAITDRAGLDGVMVMLVAPAVPGLRLDRERLDALAVIAGATRLPVGVDGGVTAGSLPRCAANGAGYIVVGRALFESPGG